MNIGFQGFHSGKNRLMRAFIQFLQKQIELNAIHEFPYHIQRMDFHQPIFDENAHTINRLVLKNRVSQEHLTFFIPPNFDQLPLAIMAAITVSRIGRIMVYVFSARSDFETQEKFFLRMRWLARESFVYITDIESIPFQNFMNVLQRLRNRITTLLQTRKIIIKGFFYFGDPTFLGWNLINNANFGYLLSCLDDKIPNFSTFQQQLFLNLCQNLIKNEIVENGGVSFDLLYKLIQICERDPNIHTNPLFKDLKDLFDAITIIPSEENKNQLPIWL